ncbi:ABC transporter permease [Parapedobacter indicus]|uniref:ABC-2 type transport system permease protein n=1 Tax=Parapedobacter indicus TaxID=1477437 RepID=A0A1I3EYW5_9SPHI|nr:ABC transporter permease [Parapedobacter indicus]PPL03480.1 ABC-2 type transport system permease protein [Parapedobacter indicus]SFI04184.1 ABC-2 type transport system permease protein [Parapedobacter indicus]
MKQFITFVKKEFYHVLRDRRTLLILFGMPLAQIVIFGFALTNEVKNARIVIVDHAKDDASRSIIDRIGASNFFEIREDVMDRNRMETAFKEGKIKLAILFPANFQRDLFHQNHAPIQVIADASDPNYATTLTNYVSSIIQDYQTELNETVALPYRITPQLRMLYNPQLKGAPNFVPGVMALVLMLVSVMMTAISIVREKETGTLEILLVSPFKPVWVILSKAVPYLILSLVNVLSIVLMSVFVLQLPVEGSWLLLFAESTLFIVTCLTLGIFISIKTKSQQVAMLISLMGMLLPTMMFSGFMFPIENMPVPLQIISNVVPAKWFYIIVKSIMIKGVGFAAIWKETLILLGIALFFFVISLRSFKIRLE